MTDTPPLDLAAVLALLREARNQWCGNWYANGDQSLAEAIALIEPHAPKPRDEWMETLNGWLDSYAYAVKGEHNDDRMRCRAKIRSYVQAERDRLEEMWKKK